MCEYAKGAFTIYVYKLRWVGGQQNVNECKHVVGRWSDHCKRLQKHFTHKMGELNCAFLCEQNEVHNAF